MEKKKSGGQYKYGFAPANYQSRCISLLPKIILLLAIALFLVVSIASAVTVEDGSVNATNIFARGNVYAEGYPGLYLKSSSAQIRFYGEAGKEQWAVGSTGASGDSFQIVDMPASSIRLWINQTTGYVGIGTSYPKNALDVNGVVASARAGGGVLRVAQDTSNSFGMNIMYDTPNKRAEFVSTAAATDMRFSANDRVDTAPDLVIKSGGNIGIGITNPDYPLEVAGSGNGGNMLQIHRIGDLKTSQLGNAIDFSFNNGASEVSRARIEATGRNTVADSSGGALDFKTTNKSGVLISRMYLNEQGNIGIGITNPADILHVSKGNRNGLTRIIVSNPMGGGKAGISFGVSTSDDSRTLLYHSQTDNKFVISNDGDPNSKITFETREPTPDANNEYKTLERMRIDGKGNVGVGTANPQSKLQVNGYLQIASSNGAPPAADCDNDAERGRMTLDYANARLYVCNGAARGWDYMALTG